MDDRFTFRGLAQSFRGARELGISTWPRIPRLNDLLFEFSPLMIPNDHHLYWGTNHFIPAFCKKPSVVTVHDLLLLKYPDDQPFSRILANRFVDSIKRAETIITDSRTTADDLLISFPEVSRKLEVGLLGFSPPDSLASDQSIDETAAWGQRPYLVMLGAHRPRKNLQLAVAIIVELARRGRPMELLVTGDVHPAFRNTAKSGTAHVRFVGVLPKKQMFSLLKRAEALVFTSKYEGFGFPILEAMAANCPVLALNTPINREISGEAAWLLDDNPSMWADAIQRLVKRDVRRAEIIERGTQNISRFSWNRTAEVYEHTFRRAC
jgi:glycosyltransferase involved in cell wall biosynthesis